MPNNHVLCDHVFACKTQTGWVLLDTKQDKYMGLPPHESTLLDDLLQSESGAACRNSDGCTVVDDERRNLAERLSTLGILESGENRQMAALLPIARDQLRRDIECLDSLEVRISGMDILNFVRACIVAWTSLKSRPIYFSVCSVRRRRRGRTLSVEQIEAAARTALKFRRMRVYTFRAEKRCLFHALALIRFLSYYEYYPAWVIGVQSLPWSAHSWVQFDRTIFDFKADHIPTYQPILIV